jgi:hypothetical protein
VEQYLRVYSLIVVSSLENSKYRGLVEHVLEPANCIFVCKDRYFEIQLRFLKCWKYLKQRDDFEEFHPLSDCIEY